MAKATSEVTLVLSQEEAEALAGLLMLVCSFGPTGTRLVRVEHALTAVICKEAAVDIARLAWVQPDSDTDTFAIRFKDGEGRF